MNIKRPRTFDIEDQDHKTWTEQLYKMFQRNVSYGSRIDAEDQNIYGKMVSIPDTGPANTEFVVEHNLGQVPNFYDVKSKNKAGDIYISTTAWTTTKAYFKASVANMSIVLFIH